MQFVPSSTDQDGRKRFIAIIVFATNLLAFLFHALHDGTTAFPSGGTLHGDHYTVMSHGTAVSFTPAAYWFSLLHGLFFALVSLLCIVWLWRLRRKAQRISDAPI